MLSLPCNIFWDATIKAAEEITWKYMKTASSMENSETLFKMEVIFLFFPFPFFFFFLPILFLT